MSKLYIDIDDTLVDTERYIRHLLKVNGLEYKDKGSVYSLMGIPEYEEIFREIMSDYSAIPYRVGALENLPLLKTEYDIILCSSSCSDYESVAKQEFAKSLDLPLILCEGDQWDKSHIDMSGAIFIDNNPDILRVSNATVKLQMYSPYTRIEGTLDVVEDWYSVTDRLIDTGGDNDAELRECLYKRIQRCYRASKQVNKQHTFTEGELGSMQG